MRRQLLQKITLNASVATVTFSNIPQEYTDLLLSISTRTNRSLEVDGFFIRFNGDTNSANYASRRFYGNGSSSVSDTIGATIWGTGNTATANTYGNSSIYIPNAFGSSSKSALSLTASEHTVAAYPGVNGLSWSGTAPISSMTLIPEIGPAVLANSTFYLYGITHVPIIRGGTVTVPGDGFKYHTFRSSGSLQVIEPGDVECLVVAGGGGGGTANADFFSAAGGGAGGFISTKSRLSGGVLPITIGAGGAGGSVSAGNAGSNTSVSNILIANAGGWGAGDQGGWSTGTFGSGGGTVQGNPASTVDGTQGNNGGTGNHGGGGGGGAGAVGGNAISSVTGGNGGDGRQFPANSGIFYSGGGGGGTASYYTSNPGGQGGRGGGGSGGTGTIDAVSGISNTGGGGGGGGSAVSVNQRNGGSGGSGIVIIRYPYDGN